MIEELYFDAYKLLGDAILSSRSYMPSTQHLAKHFMLEYNVWLLAAQAKIT